MKQSRYTIFVGSGASIYSTSRSDGATQTRIDRETWYPLARCPSVNLPMAWSATSIETANELLRLIRISETVRKAEALIELDKRFRYRRELELDFTRLNMLPQWFLEEVGEEGKIPFLSDLSVLAETPKFLFDLSTVAVAVWLREDYIGEVRKIVSRKAVSFTSLPEVGDLPTSAEPGVAYPVFEHVEITNI